MVSAYNGNEPFIFISYSHKDNDEVLRTVEALDSHGYRVWYDNGIEAGSEFSDSIAERIESCDVFIAFISHNAQESDFCREEIYFAKELKKSILVIYLEDFVLDRGLRLRLGALQAMFKYRCSCESEFNNNLCGASLIQHCKRNIKAGPTVTAKSVPAEKTEKAEVKVPVYTGNDPYLYVSYSPRDADEVKRAVAALVANGIRVWYDDGSSAGAEWVEERASRLQNAKAVVVFMSDNAKDSKDVRNEISFAAELRKEMVIAYLGAVELAPGMRMRLSTRESIHKDYFESENDFIKELCSSEAVASCKHTSSKTASYSAADSSKVKIINGNSYEGEYNENGQLHGKGVCRYSSGDVYEGDFKNGVRDGIGTYRHKDGAVYTGEYKDDKCNGQGKYVYTNGDVYEGGFKDGHRHGHGVYRHKNGAVYEGEYKDGKCCGYGEYVYSNGDTFKGNFENGLPNGKGVYTHANGPVYEGGYKDGKLHGYGRYDYADGSSFEGYHVDGKRNGKGTYRFADGDVYEGEYKDDFSEGHGVYRHANGAVYEGAYRNGKCNGYGVYRYTDGSSYEGEFKDGYRHGHGVYRYASGSVFEGEYKDGKCYGTATIRFANGDTYVGEVSEGGQMHGQGSYRFADGRVYNGEFRNGASV